MAADQMIERDLIVALGLLSQAYLDFDPAIPPGSGKGHRRGFNVQCLVLDNRDGGVLALARNRIFQEEDPLLHAEQVGVRAAYQVLKEKRPRPAGVSVTNYYKSHLFMEPGVEAEDFARKGCTLYNTFDPCGFCATTLLVCYMKRIAYLFEDAKFAAVYDLMKRDYFKGRDSQKAAVAASQDVAPPLREASSLLNSLRKRVHDLEAGGTDLVLTLDQCRDELAAATGLLDTLTPEALTTEGEARAANTRTLQDVKQLVLGQ